MSSSANQQWPRRVAILGVGLLGGSVALSLRRKRPETVLVGNTRNNEKCQRLRDTGIVDHATTSIAEACQDSDVVVVAAPVDKIPEMVIQAAAATPDECVISDVGSTKAGIMEAVGQHEVAARKFVAAHPIAGSEKTGFEHAQPDLFDGKVVVLTPSAANSEQQTDLAKDFWQIVGGTIVTMDATEHDTHLARISHVPHLVSALVARMATEQSRPLAGSGWEDITRVAAGDPTMWTAICGQNRAAIVAELARFADELDLLRKTIGQSDDAIHQWLQEAKRIKEAN